jgi:hypothetical protein
MTLRPTTLTAHFTRTLACWALAWVVLPAAAQVSLPEQRLAPGGVAHVALGAASQPLRASYNGVPVLVVPQGGQWVAVVGIGLSDKPGTAHIQVKQDGQRDQTVGFTIAPHSYAEQRLKVAPGHVDLSKTNLARHEQERAHLAQVMQTHTEPAPLSLVLRQPTPGVRSSSFGLRRVFNGQARNPHSGMDIAAPEGTLVLAPAPGRVLDVGDYFFNGNTVWLDHGGGLLTLYCHLASTSVKVGQVVQTGTPLGTVGATGRATGPHLHWSVSLNRALVDPALFMSTPVPAPTP